MNIGQRIANYYRRQAGKIQQLQDRIAFGGPAAQVRKNTLLLLKLDSIGDYVLFRNFIEVLKSSSAYRDYRITLCGNSWWQALAKNLETDFVADFIWVDYHQMSQAAYRRGIFKQIHASGFEMLVHPTYSRDSVSDMVVAHSGALHKIGWNGDLLNLSAAQKAENNKHYTNLISSPAQFQFEFYRNAHFFEKLLERPVGLSRPTIAHVPAPEDKVVICPGAKMPARQWSPAMFAGLCKLLRADYPAHEFVICGAPQDDALAQAIADHSGGSFVNLCGRQSLPELLNTLSSASLVIANDSGPLHLALALGKSVVCISNGNNYGRFTPYPAATKARALFFYPPALLAIPSEAERLALYCRDGSPLDINEIGFGEVYATIKKGFN